MPNKFTPEFKREAVRMILADGLSVPEVARKLGGRREATLPVVESVPRAGGRSFPRVGSIVAEGRGESSTPVPKSSGQRTARERPQPGLAGVVQNR